jgi:hypothetical protein
LFTEADVGDGGADQAVDWVADLGEQAAHDVLAALVQYHLNQRLAGQGLHHPESVDSDRAVV